MIKDLFKGAIKGAATWVGTTLGGPTGGAIADKITGSLFEKKVGGGDFEPINTLVQPQRFGGKMGFASPSRAGKSVGIRGGAQTVDGDTLYAEWDYRLKRYLINQRYFNRKS
jgi:hypothetical protein|tara:strand:+ start:151 stop:486 length:336 start_codon:yes stop_codon:yes gene_type:complete